MKLLSIIVTILFYYTAAFAGVYSKLCTINSLWGEKNPAVFVFPKEENFSDQQLIKLHLSLVEQNLRNANTSKLTDEQKKNRELALNYLHQYWQAGKFPQNTDQSYRTPIFIDKYDNFCAVGYLVKATGYELVSRMIASKTNLAYVREMNYPELDVWSKKYGFTTDELAWIQPTYSPSNYCYTIANGTNGSVNELFVDASGENMYVGGLFSKVDDTMDIANIGYVTEANSFYTWHKLGNGLNGTVNAITEYNGEIIAAGDFTASASTYTGNIAKWDGSSWGPLGCLSGSITDLAIFQGHLYACGRFDICASDTAVTFAKWQAGSWVAIDGAKGKVNTIMVADTFLYIGGAFTFNNIQTNAIKWNSNVGFQSFIGFPQNEVNSFTQYGDTLYAGCKITSATHPAVLELCVNDAWEIDTSDIIKNLYLYAPQSINALCTLADTVLAGGSFDCYMSLIHMENCIPIKNFTNITYRGFNNSFTVDSTINKFVIFKNNIIAGGNFTNSLVYRSLNKRFSASYISRDICDSLKGGYISVSAYDGATPYTYLWSTGDTTNVVDSLSSGIYSVTITDNNGNRKVLHIKLESLGFTQPLQYDSVNKNIIAEPGFKKYELVDCDNNYHIIESRYTNIFPIHRDGNYALIINRDGCIDTSECISVRINTNAVINITKEDAIYIYPNPASDLVNIESTFVGIATVKLLDVTGRVILQKSSNKSFNISDIAKGYYIISITTTDGQEHRSTLLIQ